VSVMLTAVRPRGLSRAEDQQIHTWEKQT